METPTGSIKEQYPLRNMSRPMGRAVSVRPACAVEEGSLTDNGGQRF